MMKHEFELLVGTEVSPEVYEDIETVYMHHPAIATKQDIADIFLMPFGMLIIMDMLPRAKDIAVHTEAIQSLQASIEGERRIIKNLSQI